MSKKANRKSQKLHPLSKYNASLLKGKAGLIFLEGGILLRGNKVHELVYINLIKSFSFL